MNQSFYIVLVVTYQHSKTPDTDDCSCHFMLADKIYVTFNSPYFNARRDSESMA